MLCAIQNELFQKDFEQERKDRERAHSLIADKDKELMEAQFKVKELQQQQSSSQKRTEGWVPSRVVRAQSQTQTEEYKKELQAEIKSPSKLKKQLGSSKQKFDVEEKVSMCNTLNFTILVSHKQIKLRLSKFSF